MKPSHTPETTPSFLMREASFIVVASTSLAVFSPRTISSSRITLAGLKKCVPITSCGRLVNAAILLTSSVEVLVARIAPAFITSSSCLNTCSLTDISSNTASITMSASFSSEYAIVGWISAMRLSTSSGLIRPFLAEFS